MAAWQPDEKSPPPRTSSGGGVGARLLQAGLLSVELLLLPLVGAYALLRRWPLAAALLLLPLATACAVSFLVLGYQRDASGAMALAADADCVTALAWVEGEGGVLQVGTQKGRFRLVARDGSVGRSSPNRERGPIVTIFPGPPRAGGTLHYAWLSNADASAPQNDGDGGVGIPMSAHLSFVIDGTVRIVTEGGSKNEPPTGRSPGKRPSKSGATNAQQRSPAPSSLLPDQFPAAPFGAATGAARVSAIAVLRGETGTESIVAGYDNGDVQSMNASGDAAFPASTGPAPPLFPDPIVAIATGFSGSQPVFVYADAKGRVTMARTSPGTEGPPAFSSELLSWSEPRVNSSEPRMRPPARDGLFLSRDGTVLMVYGEDGSVVIARSPFRPSGGKRPSLRRYDLDALKRTSAAALSPRGDLFALAGNDGVIRVVVLPEDEEAAPSAARILPITGHADVVTHLAISDDGRYLASSGIDGRLLITDLDSAIRLSRWPLFDLATGPAVQEMRPSPIMADTSASPTVLAPNPIPAPASPYGSNGSAPARPAAPSPAAIDGRGDFAVLFGSDETLENAQDELARAKIAGFTAAAIYRRGPWYASIITFPDPNSRVAALPLIQNLSKTARSARSMSLSDWCPRPRPAEGYIDCGDAQADPRR